MQLPRMPQLPKSVSNLYNKLTSHQMTETLQLKAFGLAKIPLLFLVGPKVLELNHDRCAIKIPLNRLTRNHLGSMYFGALAIGADCAAGMLGMKYIRDSEREISLIFKDFQADFLKRAHEDVIFSCDEGPAIRELVEAALTKGERVHAPIHITAWSSAQPNDEPIAKFVLTMSLKVKG
ncbi:MAG: DUF4442 domain-containing protein [Pseudomonadota bacterium]|nr:DUF4442 domain-containing protein [Pseudomonadota bacterium]